MKRAVILAVAVMLAAGCAADKNSSSADTDYSDSAISSDYATEEALSDVSVSTEMAHFSENAVTARTEPLEIKDKPEVNYEGRFYCCEYVQPYLTTPNEELLSAAYTALLSSGTYMAVYDSVKANLNAEPMISVELTSYSYDLNGDGDDEYAFLYRLSPDFEAGEEMSSAVWGAIDPNTPYAVVFSDGEGHCFGSDIRYAMNAEVSVLSYGSFAQFVISGGVSNNSSHADYFSYDGDFKLELREFKKSRIIDGAFLANTMAQTYAAWLYIWDNELKQYVTPLVEYLDEAKSAEIVAALPITESEKNDIAHCTVGILAEKFYITADGRYFTFENGAFVEQPPLFEYYHLDGRHERYGEDFSAAAAEIDYDTAILSAVSLK